MSSCGARQLEALYESAWHLPQVTEQILKALGFQTCNDLIAKRGLISALFKPLSVDFFIKAGLGFGQTGHSALPEPGAVGRRGMSVERTFPAVSKPADLEAWVRVLPLKYHLHAYDLAACHLHILESELCRHLYIFGLYTLHCFILVALSMCHLSVRTMKQVSPCILSTPSCRPAA